MTAAHGSDRDGAGLTAIANFSNIEAAIARRSVIAPEVWAGIDRVIAGRPFNAPKQALPEVRLSSTATVETVTAPIVRDMANGGHPFDGKSTLPDGTPITDPEQLIDRTPLTPDEIEYGQRIANSQAFLDGSETGTVYSAPVAAELISPQIEAVIPTSHARAGDIEPSVIEHDTRESAELESVSPEIDALSEMASDDAPKHDIEQSMSSALRRGVGDITPTFSRPTRPPGLTKLRGEIWDWIEARAEGHAAKNLTVDAVQSGTKRARRTCAEVLAMFRHWPDEMTRESA